MRKILIPIALLLLAAVGCNRTKTTSNEVDINTLRRSHPVRFGFEHYPITPLYHLEEMHRHNEMFDAF